MRPSVQAPAAIVMVRPHHFTVNNETAADNAFQANADLPADIARRAFDEHAAADVAAMVRCDAIAWSMMGISMAGWNVIASVVLAILWLNAARKA